MPVALHQDRYRRSVLLALFSMFVLQCGRATTAAACARQRGYHTPIEFYHPSAFGYLLFRQQQRPARGDRPWSSMIETVSPGLPVKAFIERSFMPTTGPRKLTRTFVRKMKVVDLRDELMQRDLEVTGTKTILESRLIEALQKEGLLYSRTKLGANSPPTTSNCKHDLPTPGENSIDSSRTYVLRIAARIASFSNDDSGAGILLRDSQTSEVVWGARLHFSTRRTTFEAVYSALVMALRYCREQGVRKIRFETSSRIIASQLNGKTDVSKLQLKKLYWLAMDNLTSLDYFDVKHVAKEQIAVEANLAERAAATKKSIGISSDIPDPWLTITLEDGPKETISNERESKVLATQGSPIDSSKLYLLRVDGGSRNNPGKAGAGMVLYDENQSEIWCGWKYLGEGISNNMAEYQALLLGLQCAASLGIRRLQAEGDSELVINQLRGSYQVKKQGLKVLHRDVTELTRQFDYFHIRHIPRKDNFRADELANHAMNEGTTYGFDHL